MVDTNPDPDSHHHSPQSSPDSVQPQMTIHPIPYSGMHMYSFPPSMLPAQPTTRTKRRQVKNACTNCQKACKKCDDARPCLRCVKYGVSEECVDSQRKERQKGIKRGPYKKRDGKTANVEQQQVDVAVQPEGLQVPPAVAAPIPTASSPAYVAPVSYYPAPPAAKPGDLSPQPSVVYFPMSYFAPPPHEGDYPPPQYFPYIPYPPPQYTPYIMPHPHAPPHPHPRPDMHMSLPPGTHYVYPSQTYPKPPSRGPEVGPSQMVDARRDGRVEHARMGESISGGQPKSG